MLDPTGEAVWGVHQLNGSWHEQPGKYIYIYMRFEDLIFVNTQSSFPFLDICTLLCIVLFFFFFFFPRFIWRSAVGWKKVTVSKDGHQETLNLKMTPWALAARRILQVSHVGLRWLAVCRLVLLSAASEAARQSNLTDCIWCSCNI